MLRPLEPQSNSPHYPSNRKLDEPQSLSGCSGKGEVVPVLFLTEHYAMKAYWESGGIVPHFLYLGTR